MNTTISNYKVKVIRKKIKNTYIRVRDGEVIITTNYLTPKIYINKLIKDNIISINKMIDKDTIKKNQNSEFYLFGKAYEIIYDTNITNINIVNNKIYAYNEETLNKYLDLLIKEIFSKYLDKWYKRFKENIPTPNLKIRKMKSRWGVCNTKNTNITLNYYLYKYDLDCLDYVIVHELSHFIVGNHSKNFWEVVSKYYPNYKETRKKLRS